MNVAFLLFDGAEELDFAGPWEVLAYAAKLSGKGRVFSVAERARPITAAKGMRVTPDYTFANAPPAEAIVVPGGEGRIAESANPVLLEWLRSTARQAQWISSVCTGAFLLYAAGVFEQQGTRRLTTHWRFVDALRARSGLDVRGDERWIREGKVITAAGVSAGIDSALWLAAQWHGEALAKDVARNIEYRPAPPFSVEF